MPIIIVTIMQTEQILKELKEIKSTMSELKEDLDEIKERFEDFYLSEEEKKDSKDALELHKKGKLLTKKQVFG